MPHHDARRCIKPIDQQAGFFIDGQGERAGDVRHAFPGQPRFSRLEQAGENGRVIFGFQAAEVAGAVCVTFEV